MSPCNRNDILNVILKELELTRKENELLVKELNYTKQELIDLYVKMKEENGLEEETISPVFVLLVPVLAFLTFSFFSLFD